MATTVIASLCEVRAADDSPQTRRERRRAARRRQGCTRTADRRRHIDESLGAWR